MTVSLDSLDGLRSLAVIDFVEYNTPINIVGMGAVGSKLFEQLICLGARNLHIWDFDTVEAHNRHNQIFGMSHVGMTKVDACLDWLEWKYGDDVLLDITAHHELVTADTPLKGIIASCVDTFDGRRALINNAVASGAVDFMVEGRCAPKFYNVWTVDPSEPLQVQGFLDGLGNDDDPEPHVAICGSPISFTTVMSGCAVTMCNQIVNKLKGSKLAAKQQKINVFHAPMFTVGSQIVATEVTNAQS